MRRGSSLIVAIIVAIIGAITYFSSKSTNEVTGEVQHVNIAPDQEVALGLQAFPEMAQQFGGEIDQAVINNYVESVGQRVVQQSDAKDTPYKYDFHVLADPQTINAFALPGGQVSITLGLLGRLHNEAELAGVLGHEVGHVVARHGAEQLAKSQLSQTLVGAATIAAYDPDNPNRSASNAAVAAAIGQLVSMRFGRQDELEADALGVRLMKEAGYDTRGMHDLLVTLEKLNQGGNAPEFFSTHPNPENRLARVDDLIKTNGGTGGDVGDDRFQQNVLRFITAGGGR
ncbi:MAG TPA: M48 family metallopeptidase [Gemmatimonadaceae bacterium]|nr:M48 family metallopeptidase [Gemmatimonadaceae bacterium]